MRLSDAIDLMARRLRVNRSRASAIANRLQHHGLVAFAEVKKNPPDLMPDEFVWLLLGILTEDGIEGAPSQAIAYAEMTAPTGHRLFETFRSILAGSQVGDVILRDGGASATIDGLHLTFGIPADGGTARFATGSTLAAIAAEFSGATPEQADAVAAISKIKRQ